MAEGRKIRVLVVDDSALMRRVICNILEEDGQIQVIGTAVDGLDAIEKLHSLQPDVVTLDVEMPRLDGLQTLGYIVSEKRTPVVMLSAYTPKGADITLKALEYGATDFIQKPSGSVSLDLDHIKDELIAKVKVAYGVDMTRLPFLASQGKAAKEPGQDVPHSAAGLKSVAAVGCSTGGPRALAAILPKLPPDLPGALLVVQHMSQGFTRSLAQRLDRDSRVRVKEAEEGDKVLPGHAYLSPGDWHMTVVREGREYVLHLNQRPPMLGVRPSVNMLFESVADAFGQKALGVILTGMGHDGARGVECMKKEGARILAQDEASSVVYGMPRAAVETGMVTKVVSLEKMADAIREYLS